MNIKNFSIIFALSLWIIPGAQADFMTYSFNRAHLPAGFQSQQQTQNDEDDACLSEFATNPYYLLPGTQEELGNPFSKLFTKERVSADYQIGNTLYLAIWEIFNTPINSEDHSDDNQYSIEDTFDDGLTDAARSISEPYETDTYQYTPGEGHLVTHQFTNPDAYQIWA